MSLRPLLPLALFFLTDDDRNAATEPDASFPGSNGGNFGGIVFDGRETANANA